MNYFKIITIFLFSFFLTIVNAENPEIELANKISKNLRCLICQGQSVYDSQSDFANSVRIVIEKKLSDGSTETEIYDYLKNKYGQWITYDPDFNKNTYFLWLLPIFVFIVGGLLIIRKIKVFKL
jgi:cytochrome c-type biogenesis protein CcmH